MAIGFAVMQGLVGGVVVLGPFHCRLSKTRGAARPDTVGRPELKRVSRSDSSWPASDWSTCVLLLLLLACRREWVAKTGSLFTEPSLLEAIWVLRFEGSLLRSLLFPFFFFPRRKKLVT